MLVSLTVGKVDAGVAVLLTEDKRLIEFPSILLPQNISSGSIVDITVSRNLSSEAQSQSAFTALQNEIYTTFGQHSPSPPVLRCRNATQTSVVLEWDPIDLATSEVRSLSLYRNGSKAGSIPKPRETRSTKISGLAVDTPFVFHLVLRTSAGTYTSKKLDVRTHKMTNLSGITVTPGLLPAHLKTNLHQTLDRIGAKSSENVRIDTTHFVTVEGRGQQWERAVETNIPVVVPAWLDACEREGRIVGVRSYYLGADPKLRQPGPGTTSQVNLPRQSDPRQASTTELETKATSAQNLPQRPPEPAVNGSAGKEIPSTDGEDENGDDDDDDDDSGAPSPPPKDQDTDDGFFQAKFMKDDPKYRLEGYGQLGKSREDISSKAEPKMATQKKEADETTEDGEEEENEVEEEEEEEEEAEDERSPVDAGNFSTVDL
ncbi:MAG: hypothetical protein M1825_002625 [Sarcosagium campestre]|nr:MAG: hypothetical protein M1825_002625 [Sarcosagium campestre]